MKTIVVKNVNHALAQGINTLRLFGQREESRNGPVSVMPTPVMTVYTRPEQRVLFSNARDANPFFHIIESLWMLAGRNDLELVMRYAAQMGLYSDDSKTLNGAYGFRWREHFGYDQVNLIIGELSKNPHSRRCVLAMWDAMDHGHEGGYSAYPGDLTFGIMGGKDIPCNTQCYFRLQEAGLDMTITNRSNDVVWGAYGANAVHFSVLQEYVARALDVPVGTMYQLSNNYHVYTDREDVQRLWYTTEDLCDDRYATDASVTTTPLMLVGQAKFDDEVEHLMKDLSAGGDFVTSYTEPFIAVAANMAYAHKLYKQNYLVAALEYMGGLKEMKPYDWYIAGYEWLKRRAAKRSQEALKELA